MKYKNFELDQFQIDAITAIDNNESVVVSAATGTGKTLIADYVIDLAIKTNKEVIYTSPIKALSNQKYREFTEQYGDKVGLLTGDVAINPSAPILIMTTEIYRNMLLEKKQPFPNLSYVVFDEIHYINDIDRGTVWEESIIFSPLNIRFLCLSATIPNYRQFADWIQTIKKHNVRTVNYMKRAVPLKHELFDIRLGLCDLETFKKESRHEEFQRSHKRKKERYLEPNYINLIQQLQSSGDVPCILFTFSRKDAFQKAYDLGKRFDYTSSAEKKEIIEFMRKHIPANISNMDSVRKIRQFLPRGFGVHHAGLLPAIKEVVEKLFGMGLMKVLCATETFAVGINMPAKTVIMNSLKKYDGRSTRLLSTKEYFQMAGRAGRRGIDTHGRVVVMINRNESRVQEIEKVTSQDVEPIISRFSISYNTALNLIKNYKKEERDVILRSNFGNFIKHQGSQSRIDQSYLNYLRILKKSGYITQQDNDYSLTWKGAFTTQIYSHDLFIPELYFSSNIKKLTDEELIGVITAMEYEPRLSDKFKEADVEDVYRKLLNNQYVIKHLKKRTLKRTFKLSTSWAKGAEFDELLEMCNLAEGDVIRLFRRIIDNLKQIKAALIVSINDDALIEQINRCISKIDRDIVSVIF
jgi:superfamily II RNA helicase